MTSIKMKKEKTFEKIYKIGQRVLLEHMEDISAPPLGTKGTILNVNDLGEWCQLRIAWDNGSRLIACLPEDIVKIL